MGDFMRRSKDDEFDPSGAGYDYARAAASGMTRDTAGHMGSVAPTTEEEKKLFGLSDESYIVLKGERHETFDKGLQGEINRGFKVKKLGSRYYSTRQ